jgi:hypothetical protein
VSAATPPSPTHSATPVSASARRPVPRHPRRNGAYTGAVKLKVAEAFPNGEGGVCAPIKGRIVLGADTPDRLVLAITGDSCQDGAGDPTRTSFTGLAQFTVEHGTGSAPAAPVAASPASSRTPPTTTA